MGLGQSILFNESYLTGVRNEANGTICLFLEGVQVDDQVTNVVVHLDNVRQIVRDGSPVDAIAMETGLWGSVGIKEHP
jgi:hypothetical protein